MEGALYVEFGLYFILGFEANALGNLFEYSYDFMNEEIPILKAGQSRYYYENAYEPEEKMRKSFCVMTMKTVPTVLQRHFRIN